MMYSLPVSYDEFVKVAGAVVAKVVAYKVVAADSRCLETVPTFPLASDDSYCHLCHDCLQRMPNQQQIGSKMSKPEFGSLLTLDENQGRNWLDLDLGVDLVDVLDLWRWYTKGS